jgi:predicted nucleotidyltransferase
MKPSASLQSHRQQVLEVISRYPVRNPRVFGSVARGDDIETSDVDILVDPEEHTSYYDIADLELELSAILGFNVDVLTPGDLASDVAARVARDVKAIA